MGIVEEVGSAVRNLSVGDRVVVPFNIACGHCFMCDQGLQSQCETTQVHEHGMGAALFGYTKLYGQVPGGQAELLRVPHADYGPITVPAGPPDDRFLYLSDVLPTAWQAVEYAAIPPGGSVVVLGLGPIGEMCTRVARHRGAQKLMAVDLVPERLERARRQGVEAMNLDDFDGEKEIVAAVRDLTEGRGPDAVIDAVGMEAHGSPVAKAAHQMVGLLPTSLAAKLMTRAGVDRLAAFHLAVELVRRGGTISLIPPPPTGRGAPGLRALPEEAGRCRQDRPDALTALPAGPATPAQWRRGEASTRLEGTAPGAVDSGKGAPMEVQPRKPSARGPAEWFTGDVWIDAIARPQGEARLSVSSVHFTPGARTAWHAHSLGQTLYVLEGQGLVQSRDEPVVTIRPGDVIHTPADEWHWHGATPDHLMTHLSMTEGDAHWGEHVTDAEYRGDATG